MRAVAAAASPPLRALLLLSRHPRRAGFTNWPSLPRGQNAGPTAPPAATAPKPAAPSRRQGRGLTASLPRQVARISTPHLRPPATPPRCPDRRHQSHGVRALAGCPRKTVRHLPAPTSHLRFTMNPSSSSSSSGGYHSRAAAFASPQPRGGGGRRRGGGRGQDGSDRIDALGRLLTRVLRHMAAELRLDMRTDGYVRVRDLLKLNLQTFAKVPLKSHTVDEIREAVRRDNKQRFSLLEEDGELLIRANQGHTVTTVTSESLLKPILSPDEVSVCVHGTYRKNLDSILQSGLKRMARLHVHFSSGLPSDGEVISDGMKLYISDNKVILTEGFGFDGVVPVKYFERIETWPGRAPIPFQR
ncbi:40S ribosomal protein S20 isoform X2 [Zea mays]|uniref:40S ribosomal protein S20 isoform X2 n=1 Tax=Zea mays TaxID=4577 RepID=UPI0004DEC6C5|nr:40S ribosomal protein S20 isoform X2 [Zea mays]|eukprot:XP_008659330.1 tRNA 2'-phosphotransferase 1 isoform X2 [Zea mays]